MQYPERSLDPPDDPPEDEEIMYDTTQVRDIAEFVCLLYDKCPVIPGRSKRSTVAMLSQVAVALENVYQQADHAARRDIVNAIPTFGEFLAAQSEAVMREISIGPTNTVRKLMVTHLMAKAAYERLTHRRAQPPQ